MTYPQNTKRLDSISGMPLSRWEYQDDLGRFLFDLFDRRNDLNRSLEKFSFAGEIMEFPCWTTIWRLSARSLMIFPTHIVHLSLCLD